MIRRAGDFSFFTEEQLKNIAEAVNEKENKQLVNIFDNEELARTAKKELKVKGFSPELYQVGNEWKLYIKNNNQSVLLKEAEKSGLFKKVAFGRYVFERNSSLEMHEYPFNHGSVWRVVTDDNGQQILVKECDDSDEVIRKTASSFVKTANVYEYVDSQNFNNVFKIIFNVTALNQVGTDFLNDLYNGSASNLQFYFIEKLNEDLDQYVNQIIGGKGLEIKEVESVKELLKEKFDSNQLMALQDIDRTIEEYIQNLNKAENGENL